jgi:peroxiredoxin Q/BCP
MAKMNIGDKAPAFSLTSQNGKTVSLSDFRGKKLLLYFYPKADTPGCTKQACSIRDGSKELKKLGASAVGISPDEPSEQKKFDDKHGLGFSLLSDPDNKVAKAYGAWGKKSMYGKTYKGIIRSSFVIDGKSKIVQACYTVKPLDTVPNAKKALH